MCFFLSVRAGKNKCRELCVSQSRKKQALSQDRASQPWGHPGQLSRAGSPVSPVVPGRSSPLGDETSRWPLEVMVQHQQGDAHF